MTPNSFENGNGEGRPLSVPVSLSLVAGKNDREDRTNAAVQAAASVGHYRLGLPRVSLTEASEVDVVCVCVSAVRLRLPACGESTSERCTVLPCTALRDRRDSMLRSVPEWSSAYASVCVCDAVQARPRSRNPPRAIQASRTAIRSGQNRQPRAAWAVRTNLALADQSTIPWAAKTVIGVENSKQANG